MTHTGSASPSSSRSSPAQLRRHFGRRDDLIEIDPTRTEVVMVLGRKHMRFAPWLGGLVIFVVSIMTVWSVATAVYFTFQDDVVASMMARQTGMQYAYEDRIADMRAEIERLSSRKLVTEETLERRIDAIGRRQAAIETRAAALVALGETVPATTAATRAAPRPEVRAEPATPAARAAIGGVPAFAPAQPDIPMPLPRPVESRAATTEPAASPAPADPAADTTPLLDLPLRRSSIERLQRVEVSLDRLELAQTRALVAFELRFDGDVRRLRSVAADLGLDVPRAEAARPAAAAGATGGPFVPATPSAGASPFDQHIHRIHLMRLEADRLRRFFRGVPVRRPVDDDAEMTSGYGVRTDPFLRQPAMHTGVDFRGPVGEPVRATAGGRVTHAGWMGGYGLMVEVDHGNGLATRYAHLSAVAVEEGAAIGAGQVVGRIGSTGRSTGPHLHYETRLNGDPVDPARFLRAGQKLDLH